MKRSGLLKAQSDLNDAKQALRELSRAKNLSEAEDAWSRFLEKFGRFFNKLGASTKGNPSSEGWFATIQNARTSDPMLCYLMQARNAAEHTIQDIAQKVPGTFSVGGGGWLHIDHLSFDHAGQPSGKIYGGPGTKITVTNPSLQLLDVTNRGIIYSVPTSHQGAQISPDPTVIAELGLEYAETVLLDAQKRAS